MIKNLQCNDYPDRPTPALQETDFDKSAWREYPSGAPSHDQGWQTCWSLRPDSQWSPPATSWPSLAIVPF